MKRAAGELVPHLIPTSGSLTSTIAREITGRRTDEIHDATVLSLRSRQLWPRHAA
jgi:hypothetical protein